MDHKGTLAEYVDFSMVARIALHIGAVSTFSFESFQLRYVGSVWVISHVIPERKTSFYDFSTISVFPKGLIDFCINIAPQGDPL